MMTLAQLRNKYRAVSPIEVLKSLASTLEDPRTPPEYMPPILTVVQRSGVTIKGYLVNAYTAEDGQPAFLFFLEIQNAGDGAADLCYIAGKDVESVTVWNIDDYSGILPRVPVRK